MSGIDRYEWYEMDVKDHRHSLMYSLENTLVRVKKHKLNVIQEVRLKAICRTKLYDDFSKCSSGNSDDLRREYRSKLKKKIL